MKVTLTQEFKKYVTLAEAPIVNRIIRDMKEDESKPADYAAMAARLAGHSNTVKVFEATAEICKSDRTWNRYGEDTEHFDVAIRFYALIDNGFNGFIEGSALLSDIWDITGCPEIDEPILSHMYIRRFKECR